MSEMIERVAEAAFRALYICDDDEEWSSAADSSCSGGAKAFRTAVGAAIAAMREPTDEMLATAHVTWFDPEHSPHSSPGTVRPHFTKLWRAMIDEALK